jgi:hypothetical protein
MIPDSDALSDRLVIGRGSPKVAVLPELIAKFGSFLMIFLLSYPAARILGKISIIS